MNIVYTVYTLYSIVSLYKSPLWAYVVLYPQSVLFSAGTCEVSDWAMDVIHQVQTYDTGRLLCVASQRDTQGISGEYEDGRGHPRGGRMRM